MIKFLKHIEELPIGDRISVRSIAKSLSVSEGTAYRAIKDAENIGLCFHHSTCWYDTN